MMMHREKAHAIKVENFLQAEEKPGTQPRQPGHWENFYFMFNKIVLFCHFINTIAALSINIDKFQSYADDYIFVSPKIRLSWTNHALVYANSPTNECSDVQNSLEFQATRPGRVIPPQYSQFISPAKIYPDLMDMYNFTGKHMVRYNKSGASVQTTWAMFAFFVISLIFQATHHYRLSTNPTYPRVMHYIEYSISCYFEGYQTRPWGHAIA